MATALLLGGGAPTLTLQAGALVALDERGLKFDAISTAGAGMVIGLLYAAPKGMTRREALTNTREMGVDDLIYGWLPINFKVFHKPGGLASIYRYWLQSLPRPMPGNDPANRLLADWMALSFAMWCPSNLSPMSTGLCDHAPWIDEIVDFDKLKAFPGEFYMNAYNITDGRKEIFTKQDITAEHFRAALAFPLIYPPFRVNGKSYIEGSAIDTLCFEGLLEYRADRLKREMAGETRTRKLAVEEPLSNVIIFDVLSSKRIIREPKTLYEAWIQSIMIPLVEIAKDDIELFVHRYNKEWKLNLLKIKFEIPEQQWPKVLDWSYSNLSTLYDIGYQAGHDFCDEHRDLLLPAAPKSKGRSGGRGGSGRRVGADASPRRAARSGAGTGSPSPSSS
jgi:NTE family protein